MKQERVGQVTHGKTGHPLHRTWLHMLWRVSPKSKDYRYYGARGITVCDEWARKLDMDRIVIRDRINRLGWTIERAFTTHTRHFSHPRKPNSK